MIFFAHFLSLLSERSTYVIDPGVHTLLSSQIPGERKNANKAIGGVYIQ